MESDDCDLRGAVKAEGQAHGAEASVNVELHLVEPVVAFGILQAHWRQDERAEEREPDLTAVGVAREHKVDEMAAGMGDYAIGVVGFVRHEDDWAVGLGRNGKIQIGCAGAGIVDATEPDAGTFALDGEMLVDQNGGALGCEGADDLRSVEVDVMVAEDGVAKWSGDGSEDLRTTSQGMAAGDKGEGAVGDEVAGEQDEVRGQRVDVADDALEEEGLGVLVEVNVAELDDAIAVERSGQICDGDGTVDDVDLVA